MGHLPSPREGKSLIYPLDKGQGLGGGALAPLPVPVHPALAGGHMPALLYCPTSSLCMICVLGGRAGFKKKLGKGDRVGPSFFHAKIWAHASFHPHANCRT